MESLLTSTQTILAIAGIVIGWLVKSIPEWRRMWRVRELAAAEYHSDLPGTTNDPEKAIVNAMATVDRKRIRSESIAITQRTKRPSSSSEGAASDQNGSEHK